MEKPTPKKIEALNWNEVSDYISEKYNRDVTNWAGFTYAEGDIKPYEDFWHWIIENNNIHNGCYFYLVNELFEDEPEFVKEIHKIIFDEFGEYADDGTIEFYVSW